MNSDTPHLEFSIPIIRTGVKSKGEEKEYVQYMLKFPKRLIELLNIDNKCRLNFKLEPIKENETYPNFEVELKRNGTKKETEKS